jgi:hypothetical protein
MRQRVDFTLPHLQHCKEKKRGSMWTPHCLIFDAAERKKGGKQGGMWFPCRLVIDAAGQMGNDEAACGFHTASSSTP